MDSGCSKRSHKHSYNVKYGAEVLFGARTKKLLFIGIKNKYCSVCAISESKHSPPPSHLYWNAMEADIIVEGFLLSKRMHGVRYLWFIRDSDSLEYEANSTNIPENFISVRLLACIRKFCNNC